MTKEKKCSDLVQSMFDRTEQEYKNAQNYFNLDEDQRPINEEFAPFDSLYDYVNQNSLSWDFVERDTFTDQERGYYRLQLSWGGPSDEFRIYVDHDGRGFLNIDKIEYWYLDWFDGASVDVPIDSTSYAICSDFLECEAPRDPADYMTKSQFNEYEEGYLHA